MKIYHKARFLRAITGGGFYVFAAYSSVSFIRALLTDDYLNQPLWYFTAMFAILIGSVVLPHE